ncbi:MAG: hypothetical protein NQU42_03475 [Methanothrix sp.]|uniref:hypothetical protein n=1 Tax=Methanothrix sp. TaxID=90426 RepID=UPI0026001AD8|nr:hypothetical protein [Methanothrix sp.]MCQ8903143.1 hypothetical protein [Methanothrix sp.]
MKIITKIVLAFTLVALSGCIGPSGGPGAAPNSTALMEDLLKASGNITSYKFESSKMSTAEVLNLTEGYALEDRLSYQLRESGEISIAKNVSQSMLRVSQERSRRSEKYRNLSMSASREYYIINNTRYEKNNGNWTRLFMPYPEYELLRENRLYLQLDILNRSTAEVIGSERVDGTDCWKVKVSPENSTIRAAVIALEVSDVLGLPAQILLAMFNTTELERNSSIDWTAWISQEDNRLVKREGTVRTSITPEVLGISSPAVRFLININVDESMRFSAYDRPLEIELPDEARSAVMLIPVANISGVSNG